MEIEKNLKPRQGVVDLPDIDDSPGPYCMSFGFEPESLIASIKNVGLINPPYLIGNEDGR